MSTRDDPLTKETKSPDRLVYAEGMLLDAQDFGAEQMYHRGRLARVLRYLGGDGTVAGLLVEWDETLESGEDPEYSDGREERIRVEPGIAIDKIGRIIEVPRATCIRLQRWYANQVKERPDDLIQGLHGAPYDGVVVDLFIQFVTCEYGKSPAFACGPYDALDAVSSSRLRDYFKVELVIRKEHDANGDVPLPGSRWPNLVSFADETERETVLKDAILDAWREGSQDWTKEGLVRSVEHTTTQDPTSVFLARIVIPAAEAEESGKPPVRVPGIPVKVENHSRRFVYAIDALASWLGI